ncbi:MAG: hydroxyethylthiazole kinase [Eubacteriaceae bacterium]
MFIEIIKNTKEKSPLVHNITNYVTVNDCANVILACGGSPLMSDDIGEVEEIVSISSALVINIGTLNERTIESMVVAGKKANQIGIPVILDPVGMGASNLRNDAVYRLTNEVKFSVIKGNISEIKALVSNCKNSGGVDVQKSDIVDYQNIDEVINFIKGVSKQFNSIIAVTGEFDIITDSEKACIIKNGHQIMSKITGTGCMCSSLIGAYCGGSPRDIYNATVTGIATMGLAGEMAFENINKEKRGTGSFKVYLIDAINLMTSDILKAGAKFENR